MMYLKSINHFRGLAIFIIVLGHCFELANFEYTSVVGVAFNNLIIGGTSLFVFISGFLFHHVFYKRFEFVSFIRKKFFYVLLPYLTMSILPLLYVSFIGNKSSGSFQDDIILFAYGIVTGLLIPAYWYIPFAVALFLLSPFHSWFISKRIKVKVVVTVLLFVVSMFLHRSGKTEGVPVLQSLVYFTPIYLLGILVSENQIRLYTYLKDKFFYLGIFAVSLALLQSFMGLEGNYCKHPFAYEGVDLMILQKIFLVLFLWVLFTKYEHKKMNILNSIAENSFGIFFVHAILLMIYTKIADRIEWQFPSNSFLIYIGVSVFVFTSSYLVVIMIRKMFPNLSRYLIGC